MPTIVSVSPFRCRMWGMHDRLESAITEETCKAEIESIAQSGQLVPVLGRPLRGDTTCDVELIYGARRLFVAQHLKRNILVELRDLSDHEAIVAMDAENRLRADISPYERGRSYAMWLRRGCFGSQDDIARALQISASQVCRVLQLARLPSVVVDAFANPKEICESWGVPLMAALEDPERRKFVLARARALASRKPRLRGADVLRELIAPTSRDRSVQARRRDEVVKSDGGSPLFRIRHLRKTIALLVPADRLSGETLGILRRMAKEIIEENAKESREKRPQMVAVGE